MSEQRQHYYETPGHVIAAGIGLSVLSVLIVSLRFAARLRYKQPIGIDDWLLVPATLLTVGVGSCLVVGVTKEAFGYREKTFPTDEPSHEALSQMSTSIKLEWSISLILPIALGCTKASFIFFYKRLFSIRRSVNRALWGMIGFISCWALAFLLATLLCCKVMTTAIWKPISEMAQCKFFLEILMGFCITGFVTDLVIIAIPIPLVWSLRLKGGQRLIACGSFFLGAVTVACALARLIVSVEFVREAGDPKSDHILNITLYVYWAMVETSMGVFAACLPTLQVYFRRWSGWQALSSRTKSLFSSKSSTSSAPMSKSDDNVHVLHEVKVDFTQDDTRSIGSVANVDRPTTAA